MLIQRQNSINLINIHENYNGWTYKYLQLPFNFTPCGFSFYAPSVLDFSVGMSCVNVTVMSSVTAHSNTWAHSFVDEVLWSNVQNYNVYNPSSYYFNIHMLNEKPMTDNPYYLIIYGLGTEYMKQMSLNSSDEVLKKYYSFLDGSGNRINLVDIIKANLPFNYYTV